MADPRPDAPPEPLTAPGTPDKISLLIVEDEALIAENLRLALEDLGYHVAATCYTYAEARRAFEESPTDLVLLDLNLNSFNPADDGLALAAELRLLQRPFIFLTAYNDFDTIRRATRLRPAGYLIKPVNNATLFAAIQTAIERHDTQQGAPAPTETTPEPAAFFFVKAGLYTRKVRWDDVLCLEAGKNYVTVRTVAPPLAYPLRGSLASVLENLVPPDLHPQFVRVNRRERVNRRFIVSYDDAWVYCGTYGRFELSEGAHEQLQQGTQQQL